MSGDNKEQTPAATASSSPPPADASKSKKAGAEKSSKDPKPPSSGRWISLLALLVAVAALAASAWMYQRQFLQPEKQDPEILALGDSLNALSQQTRGLENSLESSLDSQREAMAQLRSDQQRQITELLRRSQDLEAAVDRLATVDRKDWLMAEAEYLLRLANQRLQLGRDAKSAAQLLASADDVLKEMDDAGLHGVRAELAKELAALQSVAEFDTEGVYLKLEGLGEALSSLQLFKAPSYQAEAPPAQDTSWQDRLSSGFQRAWEKLRSYIRIRHRDENFNPVMAPEQEAALRYSLQLMVEQAQMALLAERPALYLRSLEKTKEWLQKYYQLDAQAEAQIAAIDQLMALPIEREMPDISASLAALKRFIESRRWQQEVRG